MSKEEAIKQATEQGLDLVEIAPDAKPPVAKIIDYKKFKYLEEKKEKEARKNTKQTELKEVRFSPFIGEHDLQTAIKKTKEFLANGNLVKISIVFTGRQMAHQEFGPKMLSRIKTELGEFAQEDRQARFEGRRYVTVVRPTKAAQVKKDETKNEEGSSQAV